MTTLVDTIQSLVTDLKNLEGAIHAANVVNNNMKDVIGGCFVGEVNTENLAAFIAKLGVYVDNVKAAHEKAETEEDSEIIEKFLDLECVKEALYGANVTMEDFDDFCSVVSSFGNLRKKIESIGEEIGDAISQLEQIDTDPDDF